MLDRFKLAERGTCVRTEVMAGCTTFLAVMYIIIVNPTMLSQAGMDFGGTFIATILASLAGMIGMGLGANLPIAAAPGLGTTAYFVYTVVISQGVPWQEALGASFIASVIFAVLCCTKLLSALMYAIPDSLKHGITAGLGLFIAIIGMENGHVLIGNPTTVVAFGNIFNDPMTFLSILGLIVTCILMANGKQSAIFFGMLTIGVVAYVMGFLELPAAPFAVPDGLDKTFAQMSFGNINTILVVSFLLIFITVFNAMSAILGISTQAGLVKEDGVVPGYDGAMLSTAGGSVLGALLGTPPLTAFAESATGVAAGGRTGVSTLVTALLFLLMLFCLPVVKSLSALTAMAAPALIIVGFLMISDIRSLDWNNMVESFPAFVAMLAMPLSYSVTTGLGAGFIAYVLLKVGTGKFRDVNLLVYCLALIFFAQFVFF